MVKIVQMLCPQRHCILAIAYEENAGNFVQQCNEIEDIIQKTPLNRWCGICGSRDLKFEEGTTPWRTMAEALPYFKANEEACIATRQMMAAMGLTVDGSLDASRVKEVIREKKL